MAVFQLMLYMVMAVVTFISVSGALSVNAEKGDSQKSLFFHLLGIYRIYH